MKNKKKAIELVDTKSTKESMEYLLKDTSVGIIVFDWDAKVMAINELALSYLGNKRKEYINKYLWQNLELNSAARQRQFARARNFFKLAKQGIAQQFEWIEYIEDKPVIAYSIILNASIYNGQKIIYAKIINIIDSKLIEWILWSLAKINNRVELNEIIDELINLISKLFAAESILISLLDGTNRARTISVYKQGKKQDNFTYSIHGSPNEYVMTQKDICFFYDAQKDFPLDELIQKLNIKSYIGGPITNQNNEILGLMTIYSKHKIEMNERNKTIFSLFLERVNTEIERLLNHRKLQFLASIPQQDPNPVIRILPNGEVIFTNNQGRKIVDYWMKVYLRLPEALLKEAKKTAGTDKVNRLELEAENKIYLFTLVWMAEFNQINIYGTDISQLKSTEQDMINLARFDALTKIANRQYFEEKLLESIHEHFLEGESMGVLLIDLDNFKNINDTLGHPIGDKLLKAATKRMIRCLRQKDFIARLGGDEFIVLLHHADTTISTMVAEKIIEVLSRAFQFGEFYMNITASIGITLYPDTGQTTSDLLKNADIAMYEAKKEGKNNYAVFSKNIHYIQDKRNEVIKKELKFAVSKNELYIEYQPEIDLNNNKIIGIEALLRWQHPEQGLILPNEFISIAEQTGCIHIISQWLIEQSLQDYNILFPKNTQAKLSINVSLSQLNDPRFIDSLCDNLLQYEINKNRIILDISERAIAPHFKQIAKSLRKIHHMGIKICLDNFGSPQVSLPRLLTLPLDYFKLDNQLLKDIEKSERNRMLLRGIINLAADLNLETIQKGIETQEQHQIVKSLGCKYGQGYFYCRPIRISELHQFIQKYSHIY